MEASEGGLGWPLALGQSCLGLSVCVARTRGVTGTVALTSSRDALVADPPSDCSVRPVGLPIVGASPPLSVSLVLGVKLLPYL